MKVAGIIAEYNPFHKGHELLVRKARENGATHVVAVMSGNYVQRGEPAIFPHRSRTEAALACGVDLVIQLPVVYAVSGAQKFAQAGVRILDALGCVEELVFGSECGDSELIVSAAREIYSSRVQELISEEIRKGITFAQARENALRIVSGKTADIIREPNNILGVEYAAAIGKYSSGMKPVTFKRVGAGHGSSDETDGVASASHIRELISNGGEWRKFVPEAAVGIFENDIAKKNFVVNYNKFETAVLYKLRMSKREELALAPDVSEGIENRILAASAQASGLTELYRLAKTKRYTHARIRRIVLNHVLGITAEDLSQPVPYIRLLGLNGRGAELLKLTKESRSLPLIVKTSDVSGAGIEAQRLFETECRASDIYALLTEERLPCGEEKDYCAVIKK
ncbi:MAG: nucleotidyltransferase family protein [Clostridia bacterium]|nr:nucleotidyltransferase family protein [Clostridia bacterium]